MTDINDRLAEIEQAAQKCPGNGSYVIQNPGVDAHVIPSQDLAALVKALRAVMELHAPANMLGDQVCSECLEYDPSCPAGSASWPCPTVQAITDALTL